MDKHARGGSCQSTFELVSSDHTYEVDYYSAWDVTTRLDIIGFRPVRRRPVDATRWFFGGGFRDILVRCKTDQHRRRYFDTNRSVLHGRGFRVLHRSRCAE